jgi:dolichol-phosphate mannosyltransferase
VKNKTQSGEENPVELAQHLPEILGNSVAKPDLPRGAMPFGFNSAFVLLARRYVSFGIVGTSGVGVDMAALYVFADPRMLHMNLSLAKALAAEIAIFSNFMGNEFWTFRDIALVDPSWSGRAIRLGKFNLICLAGIGLSVLILNIQTRFFAVNMYVGNLIAILIVSLWNFGMNQKFGWKKAGT